MFKPARATEQPPNADMPPIGRGSTRQRALTLALVGTSLLVALALCEVAVRLLGLAPVVYRVGLHAEKTAYRLSENPILGFEMKPNYRDNDARPTLNSSFPYVNADGQRDVERQIQKPPTKKRIIILGDSVVVGVGIASLADLVSSKLEAAFARPDIEVLNFGVMGYNTRGEIELLRTKGLKYAPDVVIVVFVDNDLRRVNGDFLNLPVDRPPLTEALFLRSSLFRLICLRYDLFSFQLEADPMYISKRQEAAVGAGDQIDEAVGLLNELGKEHGFTSLVAIWPTFTAQAIIDERPLYPGAVQRIEEAAKKYGIATLSLREAFERDFVRRPPGSTPRNTYTYDEMHPNPAGTTVMADALRDYLLRSELLPNTRRPAAAP
jgi:lysophospholipase L1-like esterase